MPATLTGAMAISRFSQSLRKDITDLFLAIFIQQNHRAGNIPFIVKARVEGLRDLGPAISPFNSFLLLQGLGNTFAQDGKACSEYTGTGRMARTLPFVEKVNYPGLPGNPCYDLAKKYLPKGAGGVLSFILKAEKSKAEKLVEHFELVSHLANVGDAKTLIIQPSATTHSQLSAEDQLAAGVEPGMFRVSVGLEHIDDIIYDFEQAFKHVIYLNEDTKI